MNPQNQKTQARPGFRVLAALFAVLFLFGVYRSVSFALDNTLSSTQRWSGVFTGALFLFLAVGFGYGAFTGRWIRKS